MSSLRSLALVLLLAVVTPAAARSPEHLAAANRLMVAQDVDALMLDMTKTMSKGLPENVQPHFIAEMNGREFMSAYKSKMRDVMANTFTVEEMNALADFYSKPIAKAAMAKMGGMMSQIMPFIQGEMPAMMQRVEARVKAAKP